MWIKLTGDLGRPLFANLKRLSAVRQPAEGATGARLAFLSGSNVYIRESVDKLMQKISRGAGVGLWLTLTNEFGKPVGVNLERARLVRPGPGTFGGAMIVFLPEFGLYVRESLAEIGAVLGEHANRESAEAWIKLTSDEKRWVLVNATRVATVRMGPATGSGAFLTFVGGGQVCVTESPAELVKVLDSAVAADAADR